MTQTVPYRPGQTDKPTSQGLLSSPQGQIDISPAKDDYAVAVICQSEAEQEMFLHMLDKQYRKQTFDRTKPDSSYVSESGMSGGHHVIIVMRPRWEESSIDSLIHEVCEDFPSISLLLVLIHGVPTPASPVRAGDAVVVRGDGKKWSGDLDVKLDRMNENIAIGLQRLPRDLPPTETEAKVHRGFIFGSEYCGGDCKQLCFNDRQIPQAAFGQCLVISGIGANQMSFDGPVSAAACAIAIISELRVQDPFKANGFGHLEGFGTALNQVGKARPPRRAASFRNGGNEDFFFPGLVTFSNPKSEKSAIGGNTYFNNYGEVGTQANKQTFISFS